MKALLSILIGLMLNGFAIAAEAQGSKQQFVGGWEAKSVVSEDGGQKFEPYGQNPMGYISIGSNGYFSIQLMRSDLPKVASNNRTKTTPEESAAISQGVLAFYGKWKLIDAKTGKVVLQIKGSSFANTNGADQVRYWTVKGDTLTVQNPTSPSGGTSVITWQRAK
jgi:hypothetical protein